MKYQSKYHFFAIVQKSIEYLQKNIADQKYHLIYQNDNSSATKAQKLKGKTTNKKLLIYRKKSTNFVTLTVTIQLLGE